MKFRRNPKKILLVNLWPGTPMLYATATFNALREYPDNSFEVHILHVPAKEQPVVRYKENQHEVHLHVPRKYTVAEYFRFVAEFPVTFLRLRKSITAVAPYAVHILFSHPLLLLILQTIPEIKIITTHHDPLPHKGQPITDRLWNFWELKKARLVFVHCRYNKKIIMQNHREKHVEVIGHGDTTCIGEFLPDLKKNREYVLFFGRISPYKGIDVLLRAMEIVWRSNDATIPLLLAGEGSLKPYAANLLHDRRVRVINEFIDSVRVVDIFSRAAFLVLPYHEATQSGVVSTAAHFHLPVIASDVGGIHEIVVHRKTGILISHAQPELLAESIIELWNHPELTRQMGNQAFTFLKQYHSWECIAGQTQAGYQRVLERER